MRPEERLAPAASAARAEVAQEGQTSPPRVELAQESREDSTEVSDRTEDKPRIDELRDDSAEVTSRGPLVSAEVNSRSEVFHRRESEDQKKKGTPGDTTLDCTYGSEMCISKMTVIPYVAGCDCSEFQGSPETDLAIQPLA